MAYMSKEGYEKLVAELHRLEAIEMPKASAAIAEARDKGDLSENSEYDAAKEAQAHLAEKINQMKTAIADAKIVDKSRLNTDAVQLLSKVEMTNVTFKIRHTPDFCEATIEKTGPGSYLVHADRLIQGVAPGQFCVVYDAQHHRCYGSAEISL